jgi:hypothetical protein
MCEKNSYSLVSGTFLKLSHFIIIIIINGSTAILLAFGRFFNFLVLHIIVLPHLALGFT